MRLVRRTLLCLVVGVTCFGAAGWMLRPKADWSTPLGQDKGSVYFLPVSKVFGILETKGPGPSSDEVAFERCICSTDAVERVQIEAFDAHTGTRRPTIEVPQEFVAIRALDAGRAIATYQPRKVGWDNSIKESKFRIYDLRSGRLVVEQTFPGEWSDTDDGSLAWSLDRSSKMQTNLKVRSLLDGSLVRTIVFPEMAPSQIAFSPNADRCVVQHPLDECNSRIEVWDLIAQKRLCELAEPSPPGRLRVMPWGRASFDASRNHVRWDWPPLAAIGLELPLYWDLDIGAAQLTSLERLDPPVPGARIDDIVSIGNDGERLVMATQREPPITWLAVQKGNECVLPWREMRLPLRHRLPRMCGNEAIMYGTGGELAEVSGRRGVVVASDESNELAACIPAPLSRFIPTSWQSDEIVRVHRWHDPARDDWRPIGVKRAMDTQTTSNALFAIVRSADGELSLQSWPLPPRDPKPYALAIAAVCIGATWWLCAWRYARRKRALA